MACEASYRRCGWRSVPGDVERLFSGTSRRRAEARAGKTVGGFKTSTEGSIKVGIGVSESLFANAVQFTWGYDVQVVTDFQDKRAVILNRFHSLMDSIVTQHAGAEIYIVSHSEGSVVAFLSLLHGLSRPQQPAWVGQVRGLMTIGSPIEIHRLLWQADTDMWPDAAKATTGRPIQWWNYYDSGDPIAYWLDCTRQWLESSGWNRHIQLPEEQDVEFARYPLAGKAHVDYWKDDDVFGHFIGQVVEPTAKKEAENALSPSRRACRIPSLDGNRLDVYIHEGTRT